MEGTGQQHQGKKVSRGKYDKSQRRRRRGNRGNYIVEGGQVGEGGKGGIEKTGQRSLQKNMVMAKEDEEEGVQGEENCSWEGQGVND